MSLDKCIPIAAVTNQTCVTGSANPQCTDTNAIPVGICHPIISTHPDPKCVNSNASRPWPSPPPAEIGCNPITVQVTNTPTPEDDPDQTIRLEGDISYISGDACLPQMNLNLMVPPAISSGGGSPSISGFGYTQYGACVRVGSTSRDTYKTPQDYYGNEQGACTFYPKSTGQMGNDNCEPICTVKSRYGANVAKFNLIGPILGEIMGSSPIMYHNVNGERIATGWKYDWTPSMCVLAADSCISCTNTTSWTSYNTNLSYERAYNNKENVIEGKMTPGVDLEDMLKKGYKPQPIASGTQVFIYGWVPWGTDTGIDPTTGKKVAVPAASCSCDMVWFFSEQNAFAGECKDSSTSNVNPSMLPNRTVNSAGMFFGSPSNANRV
jgi:hypothetical protein